MKPMHATPTPSRQRGAALIVSLVLLVILTLMGIATIRTSTMQERMAGNERDRNLAFQAAEAALREGERLLQNAVVPSFPDTANGLYLPADDAELPVRIDLDRDGTDDILAGDWHSHWTSSGRTYPGSLPELSTAPRYVLEVLPSVAAPGVSLLAGKPLPDQELYRVTARGTGGSTSAVVVLQSIYLR